MPNGKVSELNIGSTLDFPVQAVLAEIKDGTVSLEVVGAETGSAGPITQCLIKQPEWMFEEIFYKKYRRGLYVKHLLNALRRSAEMHDKVIPGGTALTPQVPDGKQKGDWSRLQTVLDTINGLTGDSRTFWACQAYYASLSTRNEKAVAEKKGEKYQRIRYGRTSFPSP